MPNSIRLLASTGPLLFSPLGWVMEAIADAGFDGAELVISQSAETRDPQHIRKLIDSTGLEIPVVHGPYMLLIRHVLGARYVDKTRRSLEIASDVGASVMVAHAPFRFELAAARWLDGSARTEFDDYSARFAMENLYPLGGRNFSLAVTPEEMLRYDHVVFDTSHFAVSGVDLVAAWERLHDRVVHVHLSDNLGVGRDSHAPLGTGVLPLRRFLARVAESGWSGTVTLEIDVRSYLDDRTTLVRFLSEQRRLAQEMLAGDAESSDARLPAS